MYKEIRIIIDIETSIISESALSVFKNKIATEIWTYTRPPRFNEPERKGNNHILYCKHCPPETSYDSLIIINFHHHFANKYDIIIEKRQNTILVVASDDLDRLYKMLYKNDQIEKVETKIIKKILYKEIINEVIVSLVIVQNLLFSFTEWSEFYIFFKTINLQMTGYFTIIYITIFIIIDIS